MYVIEGLLLQLSKTNRGSLSQGLQCLVEKERKYAEQNDWQERRATSPGYVAQVTGARAHFGSSIFEALVGPVEPATP